MTIYNNPTARALAETLLWSKIDENSKPLDSNYTIEDFDEDSLNRLYIKFEKFKEQAIKLINEKIEEEYEDLEDFYLLSCPDDPVEHDFILTANRHGAYFFWDGDWMEGVDKILTDAAHSVGEINVYVGDDKQLYIL